MDEKRELMKVDMGSEGVRRVNVDFPSNSHSRKNKCEEKDGPPKMEKVIKGRVVRSKKSIPKRIMETLVGDDVNSVGGYILHDVLIPAVKSTLSDIVQGGIEMLLFGERKSSRNKRDSGRSTVSYNSFSNSQHRNERRDISSKSRSRHNFDDIILSSRGEAYDVLNHLVDLTIDYKEATVADLYDLVGISEDFTDRKYGWTDLGGATVSRVRDGYLLNLPKPRLLD
jgi:hypothetical protein